MTQFASPTAALPTTKSTDQFAAIRRRFLRNRLAVSGAVLLLMLVLLAVFADILRDYQQDAVAQDLSNRLAPPSAEHWFGTDQYGRDLFSRIIFGARISLAMGFSTVAVSLIIGALIGAVAGYFGGTVDDAVMRVMDVLLAIPQILMAITIVAALGANLTSLFVALAIAGVPGFARIVRSSVLTIRRQEYVDAAIAYGAGSRRIILRHVLPNASGPIIVHATLEIATAILTISALSFIGLGVQPPMPEWGTILAENTAQMRYHPHIVIIPGIAILVTALAMNLVGDGMRDALDAKLKT